MASSLPVCMGYYSRLFSRTVLPLLDRAVFCRFAGLLPQLFSGAVFPEFCWDGVNACLFEPFPACLLWIFHQLLSGGVFLADG